MTSEQAVARLSALAQATRLRLFRLLVEAGPEGLHAGALAARLGIAPATLSFHVAHLARAGLVSARQEGRYIFYSACFDAMDELIVYLTANCCQGHACLPGATAWGQAAARVAEGAAIANSTSRDSFAPLAPLHHTGEAMMNTVPFNVLFLCTGNSARSIMAEAILNAMGQGRFRAFSAGSHPTGVVHPLAIELLKKNRLPTEELRSKSWDEFAVPGAPKLDFVFTVCDNAAGEACPVWPGQPLTAHWGVPDPAAVEGDEEKKRKAFFNVFHQLQNRISLFVNLPLDKLDKLTLAQRLHEIGQA